MLIAKPYTLGLRGATESLFKVIMLVISLNSGRPGSENLFLNSLQSYSIHGSGGMPTFTASMLELQYDLVYSLSYNREYSLWTTERSPNIFNVQIKIVLLVYFIV